MANGLVDRATAKVGPLPVWAWALVLLVGGYLVYRFALSGKTSTTTTAAAPADNASTTDPNLTPIGGDTGSPPSSGQGGSADNLNADLYGYLTGLQGSVDELTAAVQLSPAFWPGAETGSAGAGATDNTPQAAQPKAATTKAPPKPAVPARYYTFAPGKAPKTRKSDEAPARGPSGTSLHFKAGKGYYYA